MVDIFLPVVGADDSTWGPKVNDSLTNLKNAVDNLEGTPASVSWGQVDGDLANQTDLNNALGTKMTGSPVDSLSEEGVALMVVIPNGGVIPPGITPYTIVVELDA